MWECEKFDHFWDTFRKNFQPTLVFHLEVVKCLLIFSVYSWSNTINTTLLIHCISHVHTMSPLTCVHVQNLLFEIKKKKSAAVEWVVWNVLSIKICWNRRQKNVIYWCQHRQPSACRRINVLRALALNLWQIIISYRILHTFFSPTSIYFFFSNNEFI